MPAAGEEFIRVGEPGRPFFQLRPGEEGISVFDAAAVDPPLTDGEILHAFRSGSVLVVRSITTLAAAGLTVVPTPGASHLPPRLQLAHAEIRPGPAMTRPQFKRA